MIAKKFCTWNNSCTITTCAILCSDMTPCNGVTVKDIFHLRWINMGKSFVKRAPGCICNRRFGIIARYFIFHLHGPKKLQLTNLMGERYCCTSIVRHIWFREQCFLFSHKDILISHWKNSRKWCSVTKPLKDGASLPNTMLLRSYNRVRWSHHYCIYVLNSLTRH